jgi:hypothetical protein
MLDFNYCNNSDAETCIMLLHVCFYYLIVKLTATFCYSLATLSKRNHTFFYDYYASNRQKCCLKIIESYMNTVDEKVQNDNVYCRFRHFSIVNSCKLTFGSDSITTVLYTADNIRLRSFTQGKTRS